MAYHDQEPLVIQAFSVIDRTDEYETLDPCYLVFDHLEMI